MKKQRLLYRAFSLLLCICMVIPLLPIQVSANYEPPTQVVVAGTDVFAGGYWLNDGNGGITSQGASESNYNVAFQKKSDSMYVLTLNGANITQYSQVVGKLTVGIGSDTTRYSAGIWSNGTLYIELIGDNTVDLSGNDTVSDTSCAALYIGSYDYPKVYPYLTFSGSGSATFKGGSSDKNSCGIYSISNAIMSGTGTVTAEGGTCGAGGYYGYGSYGIYLGGTTDDYASYVGLNKGNVVAIGANGGKYSYGVYGKISFPKFDTYAGEFTAHSAESTYSAAISQMPLYEMNASDRVLVGSTEYDGSNLIAFDPVYTNMYRYLTVRSASAGARVTGDLTAKDWTADTLTVTPVKPVSGDQEVEYAIGQSNSGDKPTRGWQTDTTFVGLVPNTYYKVWARTKATADRTAGSAICSDRLHVGLKSYAGGLYIDGVDLGTSSGTYSVAGGTAVYDYANRTVTLSGTMHITHGTTIPNGTETAVYGIFTNSQEPFTIVLADGADINIDLTNYLRDDSLTMQLEAKKNAYRLTGKTVGIRALCGLTIRVPEDVETVPTLTVNVTGTTADGIRSGLQASGAGQNYPAPLYIDAKDRLDVNITATATNGMATPLSAGGTEYDAADKSSITINCRTLNATITERSYQQSGGAAIYPSDRTGTLPADMTIGSGTVTAKVLNRGGEAHAVAMYMNHIYYGDDNYTVEDENGEIVPEESLQAARTLIFRPNSKQSLTGTVTLSGAFRVGAMVTAELADSNAVGTLTYTWYRVADDNTETKITASTKNTYVLTAEDKGKRIYCAVSCPNRKGTVKSELCELVQESVIPSSIYIDGYEVTAQNCTDIKGDGTISFDPDTGMLYLKNAKMQPKQYSVKPRIYTEDDSIDLTICLIGDNVVASDSGAAIKVKNVTFVGEGTLAVSASGLGSSSDDGAITADALRIGGTCKVTSTTEYTGQKTFSATRLELTENARLESSMGYVRTATLAILDEAHLESTSAVSATTTQISGNGSMNVVKAGDAMSGSEIVLSDNAALTVDNSAYEGNNTVALSVKQITTSGKAKLTVRANLCEGITSPGTSGNGTTFIMNGGTIDVQNVGTSSNFGKSAVCMGDKSVFSSGTFTAYSQDYYGIYLTTAATNITVGKGVSFTGSSAKSSGIYISTSNGFTAQGDGTINAISTDGNGLSARCRLLTVDGGLEIAAQSESKHALSVTNTLTLNDGTLNAESTSGYGIYGERLMMYAGTINAVSQTGKGTNIQLYVNGGTVNAKSTDGDALYRSSGNNNTALILNGGTVNAESENGAAVSGRVTVQVGTLNAKSTGGAAIGGDISKKVGSTEITGCELTQNGGTIAAVSESGNAIVGSVTLKDGEIQAKSDSGIAISGQIEQSKGKVTAESVSGLASDAKITIWDGTFTAHSVQNTAVQSKYAISAYGKFLAYTDDASKPAVSNSFSSSTVFASKSTNGTNIAKIENKSATIRQYPYVTAMLNYEPYISLTTNYVKNLMKYNAATKTATIAISVIADTSRTDNWRIAIAHCDKNGKQLGLQYFYISFANTKTYTINGEKVKMWPNKFDFPNASPTDTFKVFVLEKDSRTPAWPVTTYQFS